MNRLNSIFRISRTQPTHPDQVLTNKNMKWSPFVLVSFLVLLYLAYSLRPKKNVVLGCKICPKKNDVLLNLACVHAHVGMQQLINT
jgi:hypothetical protein